MGAMEATIFSAWIYDTLKPYAQQLSMGHPGKMKAITAGKNKSDRIDARMIADLLRCNCCLPAMPLGYFLCSAFRCARLLLGLLAKPKVSDQSFERAAYVREPPESSLVGGDVAFVSYGACR
jgi:hypothetical protein